jgi:hypothetical protein
MRQAGRAGTTSKNRDMMEAWLAGRVEHSDTHLLIRGQKRKGFAKGSTHPASLPPCRRLKSSADIFSTLGSPIRNVWYRALVGMAFPSRIWGTCHEMVARLCRALSCRYPVSCIVVRPERTGTIANRASQDHSRRAEAGGQATAAGGNATKARPGGKHSCVSPGTANASNAISAANRSKAGACERFSDGEACSA